MNQPNVFLHMDGTVSAPLCQLGRDVVYAWNAKHCLYTDITSCCNNTGCTCGVDSPIIRKGTPEEKTEFYNSVAQMADASLYGVNYNL